MIFQKEYILENISNCAKSNERFVIVYWHIWTSIRFWTYTLHFIAQLQGCNIPKWMYSWKLTVTNGVHGVIIIQNGLWYTPDIYYTKCYSIILKYSIIPENILLMMIIMIITTTITHMYMYSSCGTYQHNNAVMTVYNTEQETPAFQLKETLLNAWFNTKIVVSWFAINRA